MASSLLGSSLVRQALTLARERHRGQRRKGDGLPYITHPIAVAKLLTKAGLPQEVVAAGLLHDLLEDTASSAEELKRRFGPHVSQLVQDVSERDQSLPWEERKAAYLSHLKNASRGALAISCADKLHNTRSLIAAYRKEGPVVFTRFSRRIEQRIAQEWQVVETIRKAWVGCPLLAPLKKSLKQLERIARRHPAVSPATEVEAKFQVKDRSVHEAVARLRSLGSLRVIEATRERQRNTYFDTDDFRLKKARAALKLRQVAAVKGDRTTPASSVVAAVKGDRTTPASSVVGPKAEVTLKLELGYYKGVSERLEVTAPVRSKQIPGLLESSLEPIRRARGIAGSRPLKALFTLYTDRRRRILDFEGEQIELDVDRVTIRKGGRIAACHLEVEMENRSASPQVYSQALIALRRRFGKGLRPSRTWKAEYGFRLL